MKIIREGKPKDQDKFRGTCHSCRSIVEYDRKEIDVQYDQRENGELAQVTCPVNGCKDSFWVYPVKS